MKLYEIKSEYQQALSELQQLEDITPDIINDSLAGIQAKFEEKALAVAAHIKNLESEAEQMKQYLDAMQARFDSHKNKIDRLKEYLKYNLKIMDIKKIPGPEFDVRVTKSNFKVEIDCMNDIGEEWYRKEIKKTIDKVALQKALENGLKIKGVRLEQGLRLTIK